MTLPSTAHGDSGPPVRPLVDSDLRVPRRPRAARMVCCFMMSNSSGVSRPGFLRMISEIATFPRRGAWPPFLKHISCFQLLAPRSPGFWPRFRKFGGVSRDAVDMSPSLLRIWKTTAMLIILKMIARVIWALSNAMAALFAGKIGDERFIFGCNMIRSCSSLALIICKTPTLSPRLVLSEHA